MKEQKECCIILMCDEHYLEKAKNTILQLRCEGKYRDDIVLLIGDDLKDKKILIKDVIIKYFPNLDRTQITKLLNEKPISDGREVNKVFQWHKIHVFDIYFKRWKKCLYVDAGMHIFKPINKIVGLECYNSLIAHSDAYPTFEWNLKSQFDSKHFPDLYKALKKEFNLNLDFFQSGVLLFDTSIITDNTKNDLIKLSEVYINSKTNEQGIMNIYFNCIKKVWKPMQIKDDSTYFYDYWERDGLRYSDYIMLKYPQSIGYLRKKMLIIKRKLNI